MAITFFSTWALWQKMSFVLACAIIITLGAGYVKLLYNRHKLRRYDYLSTEAIRSPDKAVVVPLTEDVESNVSNSIPFGIRAIQSGIEIDGVWISPASTPTRNLSKDSLLSTTTRTHVQASVSAPNLPTPYDSTNNVRSSTMSSTASGTISSDRSNSTRLPRESSASSIGSSNPNLNLIRMLDDACLVRSHLPDTRPSHTERPLPTQGYLLNHEKIKPPSSKYESSLDGLSSHCSPLWSRESTLVADPKLTNASLNGFSHQSGNYFKVETDDEGDLGLLHRHRLSHVASIGQLTPRTYPCSREFRKADSISSRTIMDRELFQPLESKMASSDSLQTTKKSPSTSRPTSSSLSTTTQMPMSQESKPDIAEISVRQNAAAVNTAETKQKRPEVFRRVNSGFEIIRPGRQETLGAIEVGQDVKSHQDATKKGLSLKSLSRKLQKRHHRENPHWVKTP